MLSIDKVFDSELFKLYENKSIKYVSEKADEPISGLTFMELNYMLNHTKFSKNKAYNRVCKFLLRLHALGVSDADIKNYFDKYSHLSITTSNLRQMRYRCLKKINYKYGKDIGLISLMHTTFKGDFVLGE